MKRIAFSVGICHFFQQFSYLHISFKFLFDDSGCLVSIHEYCYVDCLPLFNAMAYKSWIMNWTIVKLRVRYLVCLLKAHIQNISFKACTTTTIIYTITVKSALQLYICVNVFSLRSILSWFSAYLRKKKEIKRKRGLSLSFPFTICHCIE